VAQLFLVRSVPSPTVFLLSEFSAGAFGVVLNLAIAGVSVYGYARSRQWFFLILCVGSLAFALQNAYGATLVLSGLMHVQIFSSSVSSVFTWLYVAITPLAGLISFVGTIFLVRFSLKLCKLQQT
jgi:hypothetical protein